MQAIAVSTIGAPWPLAPLLIDHIDGGGMLDPADGNGGTIEAGFDILPIGAEWAINVTDQVQADRDAGRDVSTFRVRYTLATNGNNGLDYLFIATGKHPETSLRPALELIYTP